MDPTRSMFILCIVKIWPIPVEGKTEAEPRVCEEEERGRRTMSKEISNILKKKKRKQQTYTLAWLSVLACISPRCHLPCRLQPVRPDPQECVGIA